MSSRYIGLRSIASIARSSRSCIAIIGLLGVIFALLPVAVRGAEIVVTSDREPVALNESFTLLFSADEEPAGDPDFSPLGEDFQILRQGKSTRVEMVNGRLSRRTEWQLSAVAKRAGTLTVPPIPFGDDFSRPFSLTVLPGKTQDPRAGSDELLAIEVEAEPRNPYVQGQVLYTIRLLHRIALRNGQLEDPKLVDAVVQKLGEDRRYQTERNGHLFGVVERRFAIFPQKSGPLRIEPIHLEAELSAGPGSMFDELFGHRGQIRKIESAAVSLQVRPVPAAFKGKHWLPAAKFDLEENWSRIPPQTKVGEPITRTLSLRAAGVTMGMVPELTDGASAPAGLQRYPDQPALSEEQGALGLTAIRREKSAFIPMKDGSYPIPAIEIPWWNTVTDRMEIARIPERVLTATPIPGLSVPEPAAPGATAPIEPLPMPDVPVVQADPLPGGATVWFWLTWALAFGWLMTLVAWWWKSRGAARPVVSAPAVPPPDLSKATRALKRAVAERDPAGVRRALLDWGLARWSQHPPVNLEQLAARLAGQAPHRFAELNRALYGDASVDWSGEEIVRLIESASASRDEDSVGDHARGRGLVQLYPSS